MKKLLIVLLLLAGVVKAESTQSQFYSQLQGTHWQGSFYIWVKSKSGKIQNSFAMYPIEISFLNQKEDNRIGYTFKKDVSKASTSAKIGFNKIDAVPCFIDGSQEPRFINLESKQGNFYSGKIQYNDCRPKKGKPNKKAGEFAIEKMWLTEEGQKLEISVSKQVGFTVEVNYSLNRVNASDLKLK